MDTGLFRSIKEIVNCGSISAAAKRLYISQPALTKQLYKLEQELGITLFDRSRQPLRLTQAGSLFLELAEKYIDSEDSFYARLRMIKERGSERLVIGTTHRGGAFAGNYTADFLCKNAGIVLEYRDLSMEKCVEVLEKEEVELVICTDPILSDKLEYMPLEIDQLYWVATETDPLVKGKEIEGNSLDHPLSLSPEAFKNPKINYILSTTNHSLYYAEQSFFKRFGIRPCKKILVDYVDTRYSIACGGGGIVLVPRTTIKQLKDHHSEIYCTIENGGLYRYVIIARKKGKQLSANADVFWRFMVERQFLG